MFKRNHHVTTIVRAVYDISERAKVIELADPDDWDLPPFEPGAHIDVYVRERLIRQYSLVGSPLERKRYKIAVQRSTNPLGASSILHQEFVAGREVSVSLPRNHFPLIADAEHYLFFAGGIGITPFIPMIEALASKGIPFKLHYFTRKDGDTPFKDLLTGPAFATNVAIYHSINAGQERPNISKLVASSPSTAHIYCCGPERLIDGLLEAASTRDSQYIHVERFGPVGKTAPSTAAYKVKLAKSDRIVDVAVGQSMLSAIREAGIEVDASCEAGVCLSCKTRFLGGTPVHRDLLLKEDDRRHFLTPCVSGCSDGLIVLDL